MAGNSADIQAEMSTKISVDTAGSANNVQTLSNRFKELTTAWKAEEAQAKASGDQVAASKARYEGLSKTLEVQQQKLEALKNARAQQQAEMARSAVVTREQKDSLASLDKQLTAASRSVASLSRQQQSALRSYEYLSSGMKELRSQYFANNNAVDANVKKLEAQGRTAEAQRTKLAGLRASLENLNKQESAAKKLADAAASSEGKQSTLYLRRKADLDKITTSAINTRKEMASLNRTVASSSGWARFRSKVLGVDSAEKEAAKSSQRMKDVFKGSFISSVALSGLGSLQSGLTSIIKNGTAAAQAGSAMEARWKNIGMSAAGVKQLSAQVADLKTNSYLSAQSINALQTRFYAMTGSVKQTKTLTQGVASLTDKLKLSEGQANGFASGLSRIESSGKVTSRSLGRLEKQAPGLTAAMAKAAGMSQKSFQQLVASGKMTTAQFNQLLTRTSQDYSKNAKAFRSTSGGAMHALRQDWIRTQAQLAKPLLKVSATGLNELQKALDNKDTQRGLELLAKGFAEVAVQAAKFLGFIAKHQSTVKVFGAALLGLWGSFKLMQGVVRVTAVMSGFMKIMKGEKMVALMSKSVRGLGLAFRIMTGPVGIAVAAITAIGVALLALYKHNKRFRNFVNGLGKAAKDGFKKIGKTFTSSFKSFSKSWSNFTSRTGKLLKRFFNGANKQGTSYWKQKSRSDARGFKDSLKAWNRFSKSVVRFAKNMWKEAGSGAKSIWNNIVKETQRGGNNISKGWQKLSKNTSRTMQRMFKNHRATFKDGYRFLEDRTRLFHDVATGHWSRLGSDTKNLANDMYRFHRHLFGDMYNKLNDLTGGRLGDMVKTWQGKMSNIGDTVANAKQAIHTHFVDLVRSIIKPFNDMLEDLHKGINWVLDKLGASKLGGTWEVPMPGYANGTPGAHPGGFAKVNDGLTAHYRELYRLPDGEVGMFPAVRNMIVPLPKGTSVLDGERSYQLMRMMGMMPHYSNGIGALSDMFSGLINGAGDAMEKMMDDAEKIIAHPIEFMEGVFKKFVRVATPVKFAQDLVVGVPKYIAKAMADWIKKQFVELANPGGAGVARWRPYIIRAFKQLGLEPAAWKVAKLLRQIQTESGGNPLAFQHGYVDANTGGNEARGLLQFAGSTWRADALPGHTDWRNGYNEILAAIRVLEQGGEGGWGNVGNGHGWANGGLVSTHGLYEVAEGNKPEMIIPTDITKRGRAYQLLAEVMTRFQADDPHLRSSYASSSEVKTLTNKLDQVINLLGTIAGLSSDQVQAIKDQGTFDTKSFYKRQARDAAMRQFS